MDEIFKPGVVADGVEVGMDFEEQEDVGVLFVALLEGDKSLIGVAEPEISIHERIYGDDGLSITLSNPAMPNIVLHYTSFEQITDDISDARVYGGIHFRTDQDAGARLGRAIGKAVYQKNLRSVHEDE